MNNKRNFVEESAWEKFEFKIKTVLYSLMHDLLQSQVKFHYHFWKKKLNIYINKKNFLK
jgi:hypothetical protein